MITHALRLAAWGLIRSHSYLGAYLRRQRARLGAPKAITATAHKLARIIYNLMRYGVAYMKREEAAYAEQVRARQEKQLVRRAKEAGCTALVVTVDVPINGKRARDHRNGRLLTCCVLDTASGEVTFTDYEDPRFAAKP